MGFEPSSFGSESYALPIEPPHHTHTHTHTGTHAYTAHPTPTQKHCQLDPHILRSIISAVKDIHYKSTRKMKTKITILTVLLLQKVQKKKTHLKRLVLAIGI